MRFGFVKLDLLLGDIRGINFGEKQAIPNPMIMVLALEVSVQEVNGPNSFPNSLISIFDKIFFFKALG